MRKVINNELPFQPGEASWASWKCGGGPHESDIETIHPAAQKMPANGEKASVAEAEVPPREWDNMQRMAFTAVYETFRRDPDKFDEPTRQHIEAIAVQIARPVIATVVEAREA